MTDYKHLKFEPQSGWLAADQAKRQEIFDFCAQYKNFLNRARTEREFVAAAAALAEGGGFKPLHSMNALMPGDRVYALNRGKTLCLAVIGGDPQMNIVAAHVDSPRLDLKPNPLIEEAGLALLKTHYYGGIKKYQWTAIPLALHGVIIKADGSRTDIAIGDEGDDVTFTVTDLLPHLAREQMDKKMSDGIEGEALNLLCGVIPIDKDTKEPVRTAVLQLLNERYGIVEQDFVSAELEVVPAFNAKDIGFDRALLAAYGQDDRVCAYAALQGILGISAPTSTAVCLLVDKEEVGSMGNTGMQSAFFEGVAADICKLRGDDSYQYLRRVLSDSRCLSADVAAAVDPMYQAVQDKKNAPFLGRGPVISKYTGSRGKSGSSDASAELVGEVRRMLNQHEIPWQIAELGKVDQGGGGTIAQFVANLGIDTLDMGVALLSMHSPFEVADKLDIYMTYKAYEAFYKE